MRSDHKYGAPGGGGSVRVAATNPLQKAQKAIEASNDYGSRKCDLQSERIYEIEQRPSPVCRRALRCSGPPIRVEDRSGGSQPWGTPPVNQGSSRLFVCPRVAFPPSSPPLSHAAAARCCCPPPLTAAPLLAACSQPARSPSPAASWSNPTGRHLHVGGAALFAPTRTGSEPHATSTTPSPTLAARLKVVLHGRRTNHTFLE